jgi:hypothetical protein
MPISAIDFIYAKRFLTFWVLISLIFFPTFSSISLSLSSMLSSLFKLDDTYSIKILTSSKNF